MATTLRVSEETRRRVSTIAADEARSIGDIVDSALDAYERAQFWQRTQEALATNPPEDDEWDATVRDGLDR